MFSIVLTAISIGLLGGSLWLFWRMVRQFSSKSQYSKAVRLATQVNQLYSGEHIDYTESMALVALLQKPTTDALRTVQTRIDEVEEEIRFGGRKV